MEIYNETIVGQILGGLSLELKERFPSYRVELCEMDKGGVVRSPAIRFQDIWIVINNSTLVIIQASPSSYRFPGVAGKVMSKYWNTRSDSLHFHDVLFEYSFVEPDADFEPLFKVLDNLPVYSRLRGQF